jgi:hypothetical protein
MKSSTFFLYSLIFILLLMSGISKASNSSGIKMGELTYGGSACPVGSIQFGQTESQLNFLKFQSFKLSALRRTVHKVCTLAIPIDIPQNRQVGIGPLDKIGASASLPSAISKITLNQEVFFTGTIGKIVSFSKKGGFVGAFKIENSTHLKELRWSECGKSVTLRLNLTAQLDNPTRKQAFVDIQSLQFSRSGRLYWRQCE